MNNVKALEARVKRVTLALTVAALVQAGSALAALQLRDINGNATLDTSNAEFAYDPALNATWYLTGNNNTGLIWAQAKSWAAGLTVGTFSGWSLPTADPGCGAAYNCTSSQMGALYYTALGNPALGPLSNTGPFKNLQSATYWSGTEYAPIPGNAWSFYIGNGSQAAFDKRFGLYALAVRPNDVAAEVAAVPEPGTVALLLSGLAGLLVLLRRPVGA